MRVAFRIDLISTFRCAALCAVLVVSALPASVRAQTAPAESATPEQSADAARALPASTELAATASADETVRTADTTASNDISLDDQMLSRQRGGAVGMLMVAATPQLMRGNSGGRVTLWDEIAPPTPLPIPVDAARAAQGNVATYQRK
ncbi:MAG TPA: hypothetical protein VGM85_04830 [Paraburkholderia sp.]|jgi:hypothetical protein